MTAASTAIQRAGAFGSQRFVIPAGGEVQFDTDSVQLLITELDNAAELRLQLNQGSEGRAWKGFEATGRILHVRIANTGADPITVELLLVSPGLHVRDRRLNQVGDLGLVTSYAVFQPIAPGLHTIPANSLLEVASADPDRRYVYLSNPPGQFRELYISGSALSAPDGDVVNGGFETGDLTGWTEIGTGQVDVVTAGGVGSTPHSGSFFAYHNSSADETLRQDIDLLARGFDAAVIDAGGLVLEASAWMFSENSTDEGTLTIRFLDGGAGEISNVTTGAQSPNAVWGEFILPAAIPPLTRTVRVELFFDNINVSGNVAFDDVAVSITGAGASLADMAGLIMPAQMVTLPTAGAVVVFNPHTSDQDVMVGEIRAA